MRPGRVGVELMGSVASVELSFKELVKSCLLVLTDVKRQILNSHSTSRIVLDGQLLGLHADVLGGSQEIDHLYLLQLTE